MAVCKCGAVDFIGCPRSCDAQTFARHGWMRIVRCTVCALGFSPTSGQSRSSSGKQMCLACLASHRRRQRRSGRMVCRCGVVISNDSVTCKACWTNKPSTPARRCIVCGESCKSRYSRCGDCRIPLPPNHRLQRVELSQLPPVRMDPWSQRLDYEPE